MKKLAHGPIVYCEVFLLVVSLAAMIPNDDIG